MLSIASSVCHEGSSVVWNPSWPWKLCHSCGVIRSTMLTWPDRSSCAAVVGSGVTRKTYRV